MKRIKNIAILVVTLLISQQIYCQTAYLSLSAADMGLGLRLDKQFHSTGVYASAAKGNYRLENNGYVKDHYKFSGGMLFLLGEGGLISIGANYHRYGNTNIDFKSSRVLSPYSFEIGFGREMDRFTIGLRGDPIKSDVVVDFGYNFGRLRQKMFVPDRY